MNDAEDVLHGRVRALATEFMSLARDDGARLGLADRTEHLLEEPSLPARGRVGLHCMAAETLLGCDASNGASLRDRLMKHLDSAAALPIQPGLNDATHVLCAHAFLKFSVDNGPAINTAAAVARAVQAFDDLIARPAGGPGRVGPLAYNGARFLMEHLGPPKDDPGAFQALSLHLLKMPASRFPAAREELDAADRPPYRR